MSGLEAATGMAARLRENLARGSSVLVTIGRDRQAEFAEGLEAAADEIARLRAENERLRATLREAALQIEYLHERAGQTGSGNAVLARIATALARTQEEPTHAEP